ncbi:MULTISPECIES: hypothetical protein [unclassified Pseudomonas]|uniref:hypothetical protein n=2 Tax=Pseudomonas TaxID=286 RepID=UPI002B22DB39|nr:MULTISPECIES: hypothetical protein [unclassified Pseudomonas]MEB0078004.1 hypothetical protein [Pseudomonas sp. MH10out]MEB0133513.1 hypothetical protein [Pseudomonas sp. CCI2.4]
MGFMSFLDNFAPGGDPYATRVVLGGIEFVGLEIPESATPGAGKQQTVTHKLVGGKRIVDVLGVDYDNLSWTGWMVGATAGARVKELETMRDTGNAVDFNLGEYYFSVVVSSFVPRFEHQYRRGYTIELLVVDRLDAPVTKNALSGSLDSLINSDVGKSLGLAKIINVSAVTDTINTVKSAVAQVQDFANQTVDTIQSVIRPIVAAQQMVQSVIAQVGAGVADITTLGGLVPGNPISNAANNLLRQANAMTQLAPLYQMQGVLGRLQKNVLSGPLANGTVSITTSNTSLQRLSADQYGDQSQWTKVAAANSITDPQVTGIQTIKFPQG